MNKRIVMAIGGLVVLFGVVLIIISPNLIFVEHISRGGGGLFDPVIPGERITDLRAVTLLFGVALLVIGGIVGALGFAAKDTQGQEDIYLYRGGKKHGPYPMRFIVEWHKSGELSEDDLVCPQGSNERIPVRRFLGGDNPSSASTGGKRRTVRGWP